MDRKLFMFVFIVLFSLTAPVRTFAADAKDPSAPDSDPQSLRVVEVTEMVYQNGPALAVIVSGKGHLHGFSHTYLGASLIAVFSALTGKYLSEFGLRLLRIVNNESFALTWRVTIPSAFIGTFSHVLLDSLMHSDMQPFFPFVADNPFLGNVSIEALHRFCIYSALIGGIFFLGNNYLRDRNNLWRA